MFALISSSFSCSISFFLIAGLFSAMVNDISFLIKKEKKKNKSCLIQLTLSPPPTFLARLSTN